MSRLADGRIPRLDNTTALAPASQRAVLAALSSMLQYGTELCGLRGNVARSLGRTYTPSSKGQREPNYMDATELELLIGRIGDDYQALIVTIAFSALRITEALKLAWQDVDLDAGRVTVRHGKTAASETTSQLLPRALRALHQHRKQMGELGIHRVAPDALVFQSRRSGQPFHRRNVLRAVHRASGGKTNLHDLRHSLSALSFDSGATLVETCRLLRHSSPAVTMQIYAGLLRAKESGAAEKLTAAGVGA
jgi:integrase